VFSINHWSCFYLVFPDLLDPRALDSSALGYREDLWGYMLLLQIYQQHFAGIGWAIGFNRLGAIIGPLQGIMISIGLSVRLNFILFAIPVMIAGIITY
jgi:hypothetical protein